MHSKLCDELSSHAHAHANTLTVEITSNARVICKAHMHVMCVSVLWGSGRRAFAFWFLFHVFITIGVIRSNWYCNRKLLQEVHKVIYTRV